MRIFRVWVITIRISPLKVAGLLAFILTLVLLAAPPVFGFDGNTTLVLNTAGWTQSAGETTCQGERFFVSGGGDVQLLDVKTGEGGTPTIGYLYSANRSVAYNDTCVDADSVGCIDNCVMLQNVTMDGLIGHFNYTLTNGTYYYVVFGKLGAAYTRDFEATTDYPVRGNNVTVTSGFNNADMYGYYIVVENITTAYPPLSGGTPASIWVGNFSFNGSSSPANNSNWTRAWMNFSQALVANNDTVNCSLRIGNQLNSSVFVNATNQLGLFVNVSWYNALADSGSMVTGREYNYTINCSSTKTQNTSVAGQYRFLLFSPWKGNFTMLPTYSPENFSSWNDTSKLMWQDLFVNNDSLNCSLYLWGVLNQTKIAGSVWVYNESADWTYYYNFSFGDRVVDGNWGTYGYANVSGLEGGYGIYLMNYSVPANVTSAKWMVGGSLATNNFSIATDCLGSNYLSLRLEHDVQDLTNYRRLYCYNKSGVVGANTWVLINNTRNSGNIYEEGVFWRSTRVGVNTTVNFTQSFSTPLQVNWSVNCSSEKTGDAAGSIMHYYYLDTVFPLIWTNMQNNSVWLSGNLSFTINVSDDFWLYQYNASIDDILVQTETTVNGTLKQYNFSYNIGMLNPKTSHVLTVMVADGHTKKRIGTYEVDVGLFGNELKFSYYEGGKKQSVKIKQRQSSIFDTFVVHKEFDRYSWNFIPAANSTNYTFEVLADAEIVVVDAPDTYLRKWLVIGGKWLDFWLPSENATVSIELDGKKRAFVTVSNIVSPSVQSYSSIGELNVYAINYSFYKLNVSVEYLGTTFSGATDVFKLNVTMANLSSFVLGEWLVYNGSSKGNGSKVMAMENLATVTTSFPVIENSGLLNWTWFINLTNVTGRVNVSGTQLVSYLNLTNCTNISLAIFNFTLVDEDDWSLATSNPVIENVFTISSPLNASLFWNFTTVAHNESLMICLPNGTLTASNYFVDSLTRYQFGSHVSEFHYVVDYNLSSYSGLQNVMLYDLASNRSTTYILNYQNEYFIYVDGAVIDVQRRYLNKGGAFFSVEQGMTDANGQTRAHLVSEDVLYRFAVSVNGSLVYLSPEMTALCQVLPCQINLRYSANSTSGVSVYSGVYFSMTNDSDFRSSRVATFSFGTTNGVAVTMNMTLYNTNQSVQCSQQSTSTVGALSCSVPASYTNTSYYVRVLKNGQPFGARVYSLVTDARVVFGDSGVFLGVLAFLCVVMMAISSGTLIVLFAVLGVVLIAALNLVSTGGVFGFSTVAVVWIVVAGGLIIWKLQSRRVT